ncbi:MAG TPA: helix-turn-helix transcriptional regulator [Steroidobacteraceae bacterium]|jgi:DNA-binding CsgD family transcriptional regulator/PAS domain-containing protein|nr:helix-turn-helix transcriptional regulator [Steroidobacteraceae bacterium]
MSRPAATRSAPRAASAPKAPDISAPLDLRERLALLMHEGALDPKRWREFLEGLGQRMKGAATLLLRSPHVAEAGLLYSWGGSDEVLAQYAHSYFPSDPFVNLPEKQVISLHEFVPVEQLERSRFYTEYLIPWDAIYNLGVDVRDGDRLYARLRVTRGRHAGNFTASEKRFVEYLVPHFDIAMRTHAALDVTKMERAIYADAMDHLTLATVILDASGHVIHMNALARDILHRQDGITLANDTLALTHPADALRLRDAIGRAIAAGRASKPGIVDVLRARRPSGAGHYGMMIRPAAGSMGAEEPAVSPAVAVFISVEEGSQTPAPVDTIRKLFELTHKEAQLALCLANGRSLQEAAGDLGITLNTARAHLRSTFSKTGIDRQARLVRAILRSVAQLGG